MDQDGGNKLKICAWNSKVQHNLINQCHSNKFNKKENNWPNLLFWFGLKFEMVPFVKSR